MSVVRILRRNVQAALQARDCASAEVLLAQLREEDPISEETRALELRYVVECGSPTEARRLAKQLVELFPASGRILFWSAQAAYKDKAWADAARDFRESLVLGPHWSRERWLGKALTQLGQLDEAEGLLAPLWPAHPQVAMDLAWLWERRGDAGEALRWIERHLAERPDDALALQRRAKLKAATMDAAELMEEVETLVDLGEGIPDSMFASYVDRLLRAGEGQKARDVVRERLGALPPAVAQDAGWAAYHLSAYDLATDLFLASLPARPDYRNLCNALVKAARTAGRADEAAAAFRELARRVAPDHAHLWGYAKKLEKA